MPVLVALIGFFFPRVVLFFVWLVAPGPLEHIFAGNVWWLLLGWFVLPLTTLIYAYAYDPISGGVQGVGLVAVVVGVLFDLGLIGSRARRRRRR